MAREAGLEETRAVAEGGSLWPEDGEPRRGGPPGRTSEMWAWLKPPPLLVFMPRILAAPKAKAGSLSSHNPIFCVETLSFLMPHPPLPPVLLTLRGPCPAGSGRFWIVRLPVLLIISCSCRGRRECVSKDNASFRGQ